MSQHSQELLDSVLKRVFVLSDEEQEAFLDETCGQDTDFRQHVDELLRLAEADNSILEPGGGMSGPLWEDIKKLHRARYALDANEQVGVYRIVRRIGTGGMATVYLAERADGQLEQQVALKILDRQDTEDTVLRFNQERQILASLDHTHIARLIDAGMAANGRPYVVMEFVEGEPIDVYCDRNRLSIRERLGLLTQVAEAVHFAHRNLIIHRDIKPSNVLVTDERVPKLLDFGIAKLMDPSLPHAAPETRSAINPMTPDYASPEQIRGESLTTATDIYQLGYLLYELLTGCRPYRFDRGNYLGLLDAICTQEPIKPSHAVADDSVATQPDVERAAARKTTPRALIKRLRGDLDNICSVALRKEPSRRYVSAGQLVDDIQRHCENLPVLAHGDSVVYRFSKFARRYTVGLAVSVVAVTAAVAGVTYYTYRIDQERQVAETAAAKSDEIAAFMTNLFQVADPEISTENLTARQLLDTGAERVDTELNSQPQVQASLMRTIAQAYQNLGFYEDAETLVSRSIQVYEAELGQSHEETLKSQALLSSSYWQQGRYKESEVLRRQIYEQRENSLGPVDPATIEALNKLAGAVWRQGQFAAAEQYFLDVVARRRARGNDPKMMNAINNMGAVYMMNGHEAKAAEYHQQAVALATKTLGPDHLSTLSALSNLATDHRHLGQLALAEQEYREVIEQRTQLLGEDHPRVLFPVGKLAGVLIDLQRFDEARQLLVPAIEITSRRLGIEHNDTQWLQYELARIAMGTGDNGQAESITRGMLSSSLRVHGELFYETLLWTLELGKALEAQDKVDEAERYYRRGLEGFSNSQGSDFILTARAQVLLGALLLHTGRAVEAKNLLVTAAALAKESFPGNPEIQASAFESYGEYLAHIGQLDEAETYLADAHSAYEIRYGSEHPETLAAKQKLSELRTHQQAE